MDNLETEALYLRSDAVLPLVRAGQVEPYEALATVVAPSEAVREASIQAVKQQTAAKEVVSIDELAKKFSGG